MTAKSKIVPLKVAEDDLVAILVFVAELRLMQDPRYEEYSTRADALAVLIAEALRLDERTVEMPHGLIT